MGIYYYPYLFMEKMRHGEAQLLDQYCKSEAEAQVILQQD